MSHPRQTRLPQAGMALLVALIMLVVMTATTLAVFRMSLTGTQIVSNMQFSSEAMASANSAIQEAISSTRMFETPNTLFLNAQNGCGADGAAQFNRRCYDVNSDNQFDVMVNVTPPACVQVNIVPNAALNLANPDDLRCTVGIDPERPGQIGLVGGNSLCANTVWNVTATAQDPASATGARMTVVQGVGVRVQSSVAQAFCALPPGAS